MCPGGCDGSRRGGGGGGGGGGEGRFRLVGIAGIAVISVLVTQLVVI